MFLAPDDQQLRAIQSMFLLRPQALHAQDKGGQGESLQCGTSVLSLVVLLKPCAAQKRDENEIITFRQIKQPRTCSIVNSSLSVEFNHTRLLYLSSFSRMLCCGSPALPMSKLCRDLFLGEGHGKSWAKASLNEIS